MLICNRSPILQDEVLAKEAAKIAYRRMQNEKRRVRIHDAKQRTIGLDIEALDAQVAEKRANASDDVDRMNVESKMPFVTFLYLARFSPYSRTLPLFPNHTPPPHSSILRSPSLSHQGPRQTRSSACWPPPWTRSDTCASSR
jgi:hypothetical protein